MNPDSVYDMETDVLESIVDVVNISLTSEFIRWTVTEAEE